MAAQKQLEQLRALRGQPGTHWQNMSFPPAGSSIDPFSNGMQMGMQNMYNINNIQSNLQHNPMWAAKFHGQHHFQNMMKQQVGNSLPQSKFGQFAEPMQPYGGQNGMNLNTSLGNKGTLSSQLGNLD